MSRNDDLEARLRATLVKHAEPVHAPSRPFDPKRGMQVDLDDAASGLPRVPGHGRKPVRSVLVAAAAILLIVVGAVFAVQRVGSDGHAVRVAAVPTGAAGSSTTGSSTTGSSTAGSPDSISLDSLDGLFVATSAEFNGATFARSWTSFSNWADRIGTNRCLADEGSPYRLDVDATVPPWVPGANDVPRDNTQFPDLAELRAGDFLDDSAASPATTRPGGPTTTVDSLAYSAAVNDCTNQVAKPYRNVAGKVNLFMGIWGRWTHTIDSDPTVASARSGYVSCMADRGITVTAGGSNGDKTDIFGLADAATRRGDTDRVTELAKAYGTCFAPVSKAMDAYRLAKRTEFYRQYSAQLHQLAVDIDHAETQLSEQYGIPRP